MISAAVTLSMIGLGLLEVSGPLEIDGRRRVDQEALEKRVENANEAGIHLAHNLVHILSRQRVLGEAEEEELATRAHEKFLLRFRLLQSTESLGKVWGRLLGALPASYRRQQKEGFRIYLVDRPEPGCMTFGGGRVYVTRGLLEQFKEKDAALAFFLATQLGHICQQHTRRAWQRHEMPAECWITPKPERQQTPEDPISDSMVIDQDGISFLAYPRQQWYLADLFAWQLCRLASYDPEEILDGLRILAIHRKEQQKGPDIGLNSHVFLPKGPDPLSRLSRLLKERDGQPDQAEDAGIYAYSRINGGFTRVIPGMLGEDAEPILLIHGLRGDLTTFRDFLAFIGDKKETRHRPLLVLRFPENDSLSRSGIYLHKEMDRLGIRGENTDFICHSAGGLVFRYYSEKRAGAFRRSYFLATPNHGSDLIKLKYLLDLADFARMLSGGLPAATALSVPGWQSAMALDLHPQSLFLHDLGYEPPCGSRYQIYRGQYLNSTTSLALFLAMPTARGILKQQLADHCTDQQILNRLVRALDHLTLPAEVLSGDGVVSLASTHLWGVTKIREFPLDHIQIKQDERVMREILLSLIEK